jgi:hypothetical protein
MIALWCIGAMPQASGSSAAKNAVKNAVLPGALAVLAVLTLAVLCLMSTMGAAAAAPWEEEEEEPVASAKPVKRRQAKLRAETRLLLECVLLAGWLFGIARWVAFTGLHFSEGQPRGGGGGGVGAQHSESEEESTAPMVAWLWLNLLFFTCSTLPLAALFFNAENTDKDVRSLLLGDVQFR